jgi:Rrf2 family protein
VRVTARADYALRAAVVLARSEGTLSKAAAVAEAADVPLGFLENILADMRRTSLVRGQRGAEGGYLLARPAADITVGDVVRAVDGPLSSVRGEPAGDLGYEGPAAPLQTVWLAVAESLRELLDDVSLADLAEDRLPGSVRELAARAEAGVTATAEQGGDGGPAAAASGRRAARSATPGPR